MAEVTEAVHLDPSQQVAAGISPGARQVVIAGPGSGKTEVVSALISHLVESEGVDAGNGILVIAFSNVAVHAADRRLRARGLGPVAVQTMDSLATEILRDLAEEEFEHLDFDGRIQLATRALAEHGWSRLEELEHLVVDEVQDVVGVRADFFMALAANLDDQAGFTLLGDPAQAIYDFQLRPSKPGGRVWSSTTSARLLSAVEEEYGARRCELTGQYRAQSRDATAAISLRSDLLNGDISGLDRFRADLVSVGDIGNLPELAKRWEGTTALLTSTNGQALLVERSIAAGGGVACVRRGVRQRVVASWVAELFGDLAESGLARPELEKRIAVRRPDLDAAIIWRALRVLGGSQGSEVDLLRLADRLRGSRPLPAELLDQSSAPFVVSTVHRAKGLEFDNVVLVDFPVRDWGEERTDPVEQARDWYVAMTRARRIIARADGPDDRRVRRQRSRAADSGRWYIGGPRSYMTFGFEMQVGDVDRATPGKESDAAQSHLAKGVYPGDAIDLVLDPLRSTLQVPIYAMSHKGVPLARTSAGFGEDLAGRIGTGERRKVPWPALRGARVETVASMIGDPQPGGVHGRSFWLAPVVSNMLDIDWKGTSDA